MPGKSSIGFSGFEKLTFLVEILKFSKISEISNVFEEGAPALRVIRAGTRLTVHRSLPYQNHSKAGQSGAAHAGTFDHENVVLDNFCLEEGIGNHNNSFR